MTTPPHLPFKSAAVALLFSVLLGPIGLLYSSVFAGSMMIMLGLIMLSSKLYFSMLVVWILSCVISVALVEKHNKLLLQTLPKV